MTNLPGRHYLLTKQDKLSFTVFIFGGFLDVWYEIYVVDAHYQNNVISHPYSQLSKAGALLFVLVQVFWNLYFVTSIDNRVKDTAVDFKDDICQICNAQSISLSHHCKICGHCIKRRDHHCWFAGNCIGSNNQRYFFVLIGYLWIGAVMETIYNLAFVVQILGLEWTSIISLLLPHFPLLIREYSFYCFFINLMTALGVGLLFLLSMLFWAQIMQLFTGLTKHQRSKGTIGSEQCDWYRNMKSVLGSRWYIVWLSPVISSPAQDTHIQ